jgi:homoserine dehydrogenase
MVAPNDQLATVNQGNMAIRFDFMTSKEIFVSAQFQGPKQTAYAVLNDIMRTNTRPAC